MDKVKKARSAQRTAFTKCLSSLSRELGKETLSKPAIIAYFNTLEEKAKELSALNSEISEIMLEDDNVKEEEMNQEIETSPKSSRKFKLLKIELKKFSGDRKEWLQFWGIF